MSLGSSVSVLRTPSTYIRASLLDPIRVTHIQRGASVPRGVSSISTRARPVRSFPPLSITPPTRTRTTTTPRVYHNSSVKSFSSSSSTMSHSSSSSSLASSTDTLLELAKARRSHYVLGKKSPVPDAEVIKFIEQAILHTPSAFNTQSNRVVVVLGADHEKVWDITVDAMKELVKAGAVPQELFDKQTKPKLDSFKAAYGTILFYEDPAHVKPYGEKFPVFADKFPVWSGDSNAMLQYFVWTGLQSLGLGANLQHYNPLIDAGLAKTFDIPSDWILTSQMVFGSIEAAPMEKTFMPLEPRLKVFGAK